mmetsp:Transcript_11378/g.34199  ORF Transcript_11378/g.34199 Transcript_11378/m.34199 type:complete len:314 (+) Transcript_11378:660-1601(+)
MHSSTQRKMLMSHSVPRCPTPTDSFLLSPLRASVASSATYIGSSYWLSASRPKRRCSSAAPGWAVPVSLDVQIRSMSQRCRAGAAEKRAATSLSATDSTTSTRDCRVMGGSGPAKSVAPVNRCETAGGAIAPCEEDSCEGSEGCCAAEMAPPAAAVTAARTSSSSSSMRSMAVSQAHNTALSPFTVSLSPLSVAPSSLSHAGSVTRPEAASACAAARRSSGTSPAPLLSLTASRSSLSQSSSCWGPIALPVVAFPPLTDEDPAVSAPSVLDVTAWAARGATTVLPLAARRSAATDAPCRRRAACTTCGWLLCW